MTTMTRRQALALILSALVVGRVPPAAAQDGPTVRLGVLKFGTVSWETAVIKARGLDRQNGFTLELVELAGNPATQVALRAGAVEMIVTDWPWVADQRARGEDLTFAPHSTAVGSLMVPAASPILGLGDLKGRKIGVAGSPIDKSWLILRAHLRDTAGFDPATAAEPVFAAPALLNQKLMAGELDAALNFWHYAARLAAAGARRLVDVGDLIARVAGIGDIPAIGFVFHEGWAKANPAAIDGFLKASHQAKTLMLADDAVWTDIVRPLMKAEDEAVFMALREGWRAGAPRHWGDAERAGAAKVLAAIDPQWVNGPPPGTFWDGARFCGLSVLPR